MVQPQEEESVNVADWHTTLNTILVTPIPLSLVCAPIQPHALSFAGTFAEYMYMYMYMILDCVHVFYRLSVRKVDTCTMCMYSGSPLKRHP